MFGHMGCINYDRLSRNSGTMKKKIRSEVNYFGTYRNNLLINPI